jgi:hypothetical protein
MVFGRGWRAEIMIGHRRGEMRARSLKYGIYEKRTEAKVRYNSGEEKAKARGKGQKDELAATIRL